MGNASARSQPISTLDTVSQYRNYLLEYNEVGGTLVYLGLLGDGKFLKSILVKGHGPNLMLKIYRLLHASESLSSAQDLITTYSNLFSMKETPNCLPYTTAQLSLKSNVAFLGRPYFYASLYDRLQNRPFLSDMEKKWIMYQCFRALEQCHERDICHGDIKLENLLSTSWNWIFLSDFAGFKPTYLPEDDPADFYYYFCLSDTKRNNNACHIAPERFYHSNVHEDQFFADMADSTLSVNAVEETVEFASGKSGTHSKRGGKLKKSMDVFAMGCVIGEITMNGNALFTLPTLLKYRTGDVDSSELDRIEDPLIQELVKHMIQRDPRQRLSANEYRKKCTGKDNIFPSEFDTFLFPFFKKLQTKKGKLPDARIRLVCASYADIVMTLVGVEDVQGCAFFKARLEEGYQPPQFPVAVGKVAKRVFEEQEYRGEQQDFDSLKKEDSEFEEELTQLKKRAENLNKENGSISEEAVSKTEYSAKVDDQPHRSFTRLKAPPPAVTALEDNAIILIQRMLCTTIRHVVLPASKVTALHLITRLSYYTAEEERLQQLVPFLLELFEDVNANVRATALRSLTTILGMISTFPLLDVNVFPQYILPALSPFPSDPEEMVRIAFAEVLPRLAEHSRRFLDIAQAMKTIHGNSETPFVNNATKNPTSETRFDFELRRLHTQIARFVIQITAPDAKTSSSIVKRVLLKDITRLSIFFGRERTLDVILPQLITFLNDKDWELRKAFFEHIPGVCAFIGRISLELYILPCIEQALVDVEELVITRAIDALATICELGLFQRPSLIGKVKSTAPLLYHPCGWIRKAVFHLIHAVSTQLGVVDTHAFLLPVLRPYLSTSTFIGQRFDMDYIKKMTREPVGREAYDKSLIASDTVSSFSLVDLSESFVDISIKRISVDSDASQDEREKLEVMAKYIEAASRHMQSKLQLAESRSLSGSGSKSASDRRPHVLHRSIVHVLKVPDIRFAYMHAPPLRPPRQMILSPQDSKKTSEFVQVSMPYLIRLYGLQGVSTGIGEERNVSTTSASINLDIHAAFGEALDRELRSSERAHRMALHPHQGTDSTSTSVKLATVVKLESKTLDPALLDSRWLASRIFSLGLLPLPPDMGPLVSDTGAYFSLYSLPLSIHGGRGPDEGVPSSDAKETAVIHANNIGVRNKQRTTSFTQAMLTATELSPSNTMYDVAYKNWKPKEGTLVAQMAEHGGSVNRLAVSSDFQFIASGSSDRTVKLWSTKNLAHSVRPCSMHTFTAKDAVLDVTVCHNSHTVAAGTRKGVVHVFRVDGNNSSTISSPSTRGREAELSWIRTLNSPDASSILAVRHMHTVSESLLIYATRSGWIYGWDLRTRAIALEFRITPELGYITSMVHGTDATWIAVGTSRGYIALWDIRFQLLVKVWRHASHGPIFSLELSGSPMKDVSTDSGHVASCRPLVYVAAGDNEAAAFDLTNGACRGLFRSLGPHVEEAEARRCVSLEHVAHRSVKGSPVTLVSPGAYKEALNDLQYAASGRNAVRTILCPSNTLRGVSFGLVTAGEDRQIRYWDLRHPKQSFTISGLPPGTPASFYDCQQAPTGWWRDKHGADWLEKTSHNGSKSPMAKLVPPMVYMCQDATVPHSPSFNPAVERSGPVPPSPSHSDCVLDLKMLDLHSPMIASCGRDGLIKIWG